MSQTEKDKYPKWSPRYWLAYIAIALIWCISLLPYRALLCLGKGLGWLLFVVDGRMRKVAKTNLELCFPDLSAKAREELLLQSYASLGQGAVETALGWWGQDKRLQSMLEIEGLEHIQRALDEGHGVLMVTAHFSSLELCGRLLSQHLRFVATYREQRHPVIQKVTYHARQKYYAALIEKDNIRQIVRALKNKQVVFYAADTDAGKHGVFVPFLGIKAATVTAPARYAKMTNAKIIPFAFWRKSDGSGYKMKFILPKADFPSHDREQDAAYLNQVIEKAVRQRPNQYLWQYRRFKTRPPGEFDFYWRKK